MSATTHGPCAIAVAQKRWCGCDITSVNLEKINT